jgi:hypothetical protein
MAVTPTAALNQLCLDCGQAFHCGIADSTPCWCATGVAPLMPMPEEASGCYCPECLKKRIAARQPAARDPII